MVDIRVRGASIFAHSRRTQGKKVVERRFAEDLEYEPAPYGFNLAASPTIKMAYSEDSFPFTMKQSLINRLSIDPIHALANAWRMRRADAIWTILEWEWLSVSLLQRLRIVPRVPVIANSVWLFQDWQKWSEKKRRLFRWLMTDNVVLTVHAKTSLDIARTALPEKDFQLSYFGVSTNAFPLMPPVPTQADSRPIRIYSIGHDRTRDWKALMDAFGNDDRFEVRLVCRWTEDVIDPSAYNNFTQPPGRTMTEMRANYAWADIVVVPMFDNVFSGITVALEGAAVGKPVICSRTGGVPTYFDEDEVIFVPPGDPTALRDAALSDPAILLSRAVRAQARFVESGYSAAAMMDRYLTLTNQALSRTAK